MASQKPKFMGTTALEASSYQEPGGGELYAHLRKNVVEQAVAMGYDRATMVEYNITWSDDHDPFQHVKNHAYPRFITMCNTRVFQSFEKQLKERYVDLMSARKIGVVVKSTTLNLMRPVKFPDSLVIAHHLAEVYDDRYLSNTSIWSLQQQAIVAESKGFLVFFDFDKGVPANLVEAGGVYKDLHEALVERKEREARIKAKWEQEHPPKKSKAKPKL